MSQPMTATLSHYMARQDRVGTWADALPDFLAMDGGQRAAVVAGVTARARSQGWDVADAVLAGIDPAAAAAAAEPGVQNTTPDNDRLKVLIDGDSQRMVTRLYQDFVSEENFVLFIEFVKGLDRYILKFRELAKSRDVSSQIPPAEGQGQPQRGSRGGRGRGGGGRGGPAAGAPAPADDGQAQVAPPNPEELAKPDAPSATIAGLSNFINRALD